MKNIIMFLGVVLAAYSLYTTASGFILDWGFIPAIILSSFISIFMVVIDYYQLSNSKTSLSAALFWLLVYIGIAIPSLMGNFNALYSTRTKKKIYNEELTKLKSMCLGIYTKSKEVLSDPQKKVDDLKAKVNTKKDQLKMQITDPANLGCKERCEALLVEIEALLDIKLTRLSGSPDILAKNYEEQIRKVLSNLIQVRVRDSENAIIKIDNEYRGIDQIIDKALIISNIEDEGREAIVKALNVYNNIGTQTQGIIPTFAFTKANSHALDVGSITHSWEQRDTYPTDKNMALLFCFFIDFSIPIILLFLTKRGEETTEKVPPPPRTDKMGNTFKKNRKNH